MAATQLDAELRREVLALLEADEGAAHTFLESPAVPAVRIALETRLGALPEHIGPYRVLRELGRGGMGVVYLASRDDDAYRKDVAIKIVRAGFDSELLRRFRCERQILADLDHPHIARLLDGGNTDHGYPYLVMEYIDGEPITSYCDHHRLPIPNRLRLFQAVCAAVHHAHQNGIVHRDLKPANILIERNATPRLLDFGIAKLLQASPRSEPGSFTSVMHPMTPDYASPEQVRGDKVTPASDLFSLGVLLYELVTGIRPYAVKNRTAFEVEKAILDTTPILPSTQAYRNGALAAELRGTTPDKLRCLLKGDIDNIILVALRTAPERRYTTASALGDDIRRHLEALPVAARSDSIGYRASTFIRRNKRAAAVAGLGVVAVGAVTGIAVWQGRGAVAQRQALEGRSREASRFGIELLNDVYRNQKKMSNRGRKGLKGQGPDSLDGMPGGRGSDQDPHANLAWIYGFKGAPRTEGPHGSAGGVTPALVDYEKAIRVLEPMVAADVTDVNTQRLLALTYERQAWTLRNTNAAFSLETHRRQLMATERLVRLRPDPPVQVYLATALRSVGERLGHPYFANVGNTAAARLEIERATRIAEQWAAKLPPGEGTWYTGYCYSTLAGMLWAEGDIKAAIALQQRAISAFQSIPSSLPNWREIQSELGMTHVRMANFLYHDGQHENASHSAQQGIAIIEPLFRQDPKSVNLRQHVMAAWDQSGYAWLASDPRRALRVYRDAEQAGADWLPAHPQALEILEGLAESRSGIARAAAVLGDVKLADEKSEEAVANADSLVGLDPGNAHYRFSLALAYEYRGEVMEKIKPAIAVQNYRKALGTVQPMADADRASYLKFRLVSDLRDRLKRVF